MTRHIKASYFKAKCLALIDEVARTGAAIIITKDGKPVAQLIPHRPRDRNVRGILKHELFIGRQYHLADRYRMTPPDGSRPALISDL